jgi:hypothetical protein
MVQRWHVLEVEFHEHGSCLSIHNNPALFRGQAKRAFSSNNALSDDDRRILCSGVAASGVTAGGTVLSGVDPNYKPHYNDDGVLVPPRGPNQIATDGSGGVLSVCPDLAFDGREHTGWIGDCAVSGDLALDPCNNRGALQLGLYFMTRNIFNSEHKLPRRSKLALRCLDCMYRFRDRISLLLKVILRK